MSQVLVNNAASLGPIDYKKVPSQLPACPCLSADSSLASSHGCVPQQWISSAWLPQGDNMGQGPLDGSPDDWQRTLNINLVAIQRTVRWLAPAMKERCVRVAHTSC